MKRIDLHTHAKLSKTLPFAMRTVHQFIAQGRRLGLDGAALVEHMHAVHYWEIHDRLRRELRSDETAGVYEGPDGFRLLSGAELSIAEGCHLIMLSTVAQLTEFDRSLAKPATLGYRPRFDEASLRDLPVRVRRCAWPFGSPYLLVTPLLGPLDITTL